MAAATSSSCGRGQAVWLIMLLLVGSSNQSRPATAATVVGNAKQQLEIGVNGNTPTLMATAKLQQQHLLAKAATTTGSNIAKLVTTTAATTVTDTAAIAATGSNNISQMPTAAAIVTAAAIAKVSNIVNQMPTAAATTAAVTAATDTAATATDTAATATGTAATATDTAATATDTAATATDTAATATDTAATATDTAATATDTAATATDTAATATDTAATATDTAATATDTAATATDTAATPATGSNNTPKLPTTAAAEATAAMPTTTTTTVATPAATSTPATAASNIPAMVLLLDLEQTAAPPLNDGHDGRKLTMKKQLQQQHFELAAAAATTIATSNMETETETTTTISSSSSSSSNQLLLPVPNGYLGPIFMGEKTFGASHPSKKKDVDNIELQLRQGRIVEILAPTALLESNVESSTSSGAASTTVFQVAEQETPSLPEPRSESRISDIQIEVYDSTVDSILAATNFKDNPTQSPQSQSQLQPLQERFTQYVIDRADVSTQPAAAGKPQPAAIEIHINVSEAFGSESEDLEFSYRKPGRPSDEILVVEIIDASAENASSVEQSPPAVRPPQEAADELFMPDTSRGLVAPPPPPPPPPPPQQQQQLRRPSIDRDSDTIFYISNTEVKVRESLPTTSSSSSSSNEQRKLQFENQFFPASYLEQQQQQQKQQQQKQQNYEEDILLGPLHRSGDALKILRSPGSGDGAPPLDVTYVGESVIEVEQQALPASSAQPAAADIVIQPAVLPELSIGVPVIGELPPQIELKEIDYMPGELLGGRYENEQDNDNEIESNGLGLGLGLSDPDVLESSIQYGGDLIDDGAGGGFDGVEGSYPFDSPAHRRQQQQRDSRGFFHSHLRREQLPVAELLNATLQLHNESGLGGGASAMAPLLHAERVGNATALSEDPSTDYDGFLNLFAVSMGLVIVVLPAALLTSMYCAVRYLLNKNAAANAASEDSEQGQEQPKHESTSSASPLSQLNSSSYSRSISFTNSSPQSNPNAALIRSMSLALQRIQFQFEASSEQATPTMATATPTMATQLPSLGFSGSVTKMTLKDNHLIVVTEERHDISRNARETKMHTDKEGVFVVEVARGIDSKQPPDSPAGANPMPPSNDITELPFDTRLLTSEPPSHEQVQIHAPPSDFASPLPVVGLQLIEEELREELPAEEPQQLQTGLSQSDLSSTSSSDSNKRYSYGNQELYVIEQPGVGFTGRQLEAPAGFGNEQELEKAAPAENGVELEPNYDSLMSLPAPPSNEEIKELDNLTLLESSQMDSLPPPPPPPPTNKEEDDKKDKPEEQPTLKLTNGNKPDPNPELGVPGEPSTLTPPASAPASPTVTLCAGSLSNGIHAVVAVHGS